MPIDLSSPATSLPHMRRRTGTAPWRDVPRRALRRCRRLLADCRWKYLGYDYVPIAAGVRLRIDSAGRLGHLLRERHFEAAEQLFLRRFLRSGDVFIDVGANIGLYTLLAGSLVGSTGRVLAFEPCSATFDRLEHNVRQSRLPGIECHRVALSDRAGQAQLYVSQSGFDAWNSLAGCLAEGPFASESVPTQTWDEFAADRLQPAEVAMMKIDVEGWELPVLDGAASFLAHPDAPLLQVEFTAENAVAAGSTCQRLFERIRDLGYRLYRYDANANGLCEVHAAPPEDYCNLYGTKHLDRVIGRLTTDDACGGRSP